MVCPYCKNSVPDGTRYCPYCNSPLPVTVPPKPETPSKPVRKAQSRPTDHADTTIPDIAEWSESAKQDQAKSASSRPAGAFTIPGLGTVSRVELAGRAKHFNVKALIIILTLCALIALVGVGSYFAVPALSRVERDHDCARATVSAQQDVKQWATQTRLSQQLLTADPDEYSDQKVVDQVRKSMRNAPTDLVACTVNPARFGQQARAPRQARRLDTCQSGGPSLTQEGCE